jgi:malate/lactate dehydrogenase
MKIGVIGAGAVGTACLLSVIMRGVAREIVVVKRDRKRATGDATDLQYGAMPGVLGRAGVAQILEPGMSEEERQALHRSAETLRKAVAGMQGSKYSAPAA